MLHFQVLDDNSLDLLKQIQANPNFSGTRLVGGTALALQFGHRKSIDLDLFGHMDLDPMEISQELQTYGTLAVRSASSRIQRFILRGVQVDIVRYDYPWLDDPIPAEGLRLASARDIAAMKLAAITNRGSKKDFIDLAFLLDRYTLTQMLDFYAMKFKDGSLFTVLKSLVFFDDAETDPMPNMLEPLDWKAAKERIRHALESTPLCNTF